MKKIQVLGGGYCKCIILAEELSKAAVEMDIVIELEKITDFQKIMEFGVMTSSATVLDNQVKFSRKVLKVETLKEFLK